MAITASIRAPLTYRSGCVEFAVAAERVRWDSEWCRWILLNEHDVWVEMVGPEKFWINEGTTLKDLRPDCVNR